MTINFNADWNWPELCDAYFDDCKYVNITAGRRSGKTYGGFLWIIEELLAVSNLSGLWVDTAHRNIDAYVERYLFKGGTKNKAILYNCWNDFNWRKQEKILHFPNGSFLQFGSAERPELLEGFGYDRVILNESGIILKKGGLWDNTIEPMLQGSESKCRNIGTPKGKNKFHDLFAKGKSNIPNWKSYHFSALESPNWDYDELIMNKPNIPEEVWRQEYLAEFLDGTGSVFRHVDRSLTDRIETYPKLGARYVMSVDLAKHVDFTVIYILDIETKEVVHQDRFNQIDWTLQCDRIVNTWNTWNCTACIVDATGIGDVVVDQLESRGLAVTGFKINQINKNLIIRNLSIALEQQEIRIYPFEELISELEVFEYYIMPSGGFRYSAPDGLHDDCVLSLALMYELVREYVDYSTASYF